MVTNKHCCGVNMCKPKTLLTIISEHAEWKSISCVQADVGRFPRHGLPSSWLSPWTEVLIIPNTSWTICPCRFIIEQLIKTCVSCCVIVFVRSTPWVVTSSNASSDGSSACAGAPAARAEAEATAPSRLRRPSPVVSVSTQPSWQLLMQLNWWHIGDVDCEFYVKVWDSLCPYLLKIIQVATSCAFIWRANLSGNYWRYEPRSHAPYSDPQQPRWASELRISTARHISNPREDVKLPKQLITNINWKKNNQKHTLLLTSFDHKVSLGSQTIRCSFLSTHRYNPRLPLLAHTSKAFLQASLGTPNLPQQQHLTIRGIFFATCIALTSQKWRTMDNNHLFRFRIIWFLTDFWSDKSLDCSSFWRKPNRQATVKRTGAAPVLRLMHFITNGARLSFSQGGAEKICWPQRNKFGIVLGINCKLPWDIFSYLWEICWEVFWTIVNSYFSLGNVELVLDDHLLCSKPDFEPGHGCRFFSK